MAIPSVLKMLHCKLHVLLTFSTTFNSFNVICMQHETCVTRVYKHWSLIQYSRKLLGWDKVRKWDTGRKLYWNIQRTNSSFITLAHLWSWNANIKQFIQCFGISYRRHYSREVCIHKHQIMRLKWRVTSTIWHGS